jgi:hypothetical protein
MSESASRTEETGLQMAAVEESDIGGLLDAEKSFAKASLDGKPGDGEPLDGSMKMNDDTLIGGDNAGCDEKRFVLYRKAISSVSSDLLFRSIERI